jgi:hypothetical protein
MLAMMGSGASVASFAPRALAQEIAADDPQKLLRRELQRSQPDYVAYVPKHWDGSTNDSHNEHFLVFEGKGRALMAVWTQTSGLPGLPPKNRIMFSRSEDDGVTWAPPKRLVGPANHDDPALMASWAFPMVSKTNRIYVIYNRNDGSKGWIHFHTGKMEGIYSDDGGATWSAPQRIEMPVSPYDDPEGKVAPEWIVWQSPMRDLKGGYFIGYSRWPNKARAYYKEVEAWTQIESVCEFMRFENVDANPEPRGLRIRYSAWGEKALRAPYYRDPLLSVAQEPSIVRLPDRSLFCVMRTNSGYIWHSVSKDDGENWSSPRPLLRKDFGQPILQPVNCCPIYQLADGRYVLLHHNNRGDISAKPEKSMGPRWPAYIALGEFRPGADQPLWFSESKMLMTHDGVTVNGRREGEPGAMNPAIGVYSSFTTRGGNNVLWHPDRKFFLVGKKITDEFLAGLKVPKG